MKTRQRIPDSHPARRVLHLLRSLLTRRALLGTGATTLILLLLLPLLVAPGQPTASPVLAADDTTGQAPAALNANPFRAVTSALTATVVLGQSQPVALTLTNTAPAGLTPLLYEAQAVPAPGARLQEAVPPELQRVALPDQAERVDPQIATDLQQSPDGQTAFLVLLADQADLSAAYSIADWSKRGWYVYHTLQQHAEQNQRGLRDWLDARGLAYQPFWIVNGLLVRGTADDVNALASRSDVAMLHANNDVASVPIPGEGTASSDELALAQTTDPAIGWNIQQIQADRVWNDYGVSGQGITVANIDSGVKFNHPALVQQYRGYRSGSPFEHAYNWYDPSGAAAVPTDNINHGTHVMGTMVGRGFGTSEQPAVGVAPGARWIAGRGCPTNICPPTYLIDAAQWMLAPTDADGKHPRPDLRPHIINNSWAGGSNDDFYLAYVTAWRAAGIFPVFVSGNTSHDTCGTVASPGNYNNVFAVGATDRTDIIASFSGIGPAQDGMLKPALMAPGQSIISTYASRAYGSSSGTSMAAPHAAGAVALLWSANPTLIGDYDKTYDFLTRNAFPRTDPNFSGPDYADCLANSVPNNVYGHGRLDIYTAVTRARVDVPWLDLPTNLAAIRPGLTSTLQLTFDAGAVPGPGTYRARVLIGTGDLSQSMLPVDLNLIVQPAPQQATVLGFVRDGETGATLNAQVKTDTGIVQAAGETGYSLTLPLRPEPYTLQATAAGYTEQTVVLTLTTGTTRSQNFNLLTDIPRLSIGPVPSIQVVNPQLISATLALSETATYPLELHNAGSQPLTYTLQAPAEPFQLVRSDTPGGLPSQWIDLPTTGTITLTLADDSSSTGLALGFGFPFYSVQYDTVYVSSNGMLSFAPFLVRRGFTPACLSIPDSTGTAIVPFRADLDPSQGGTIRAAEVPEGFVVAFEDVPLHNADAPGSGPTFSFQVLIARDGRILFNYGTLGTLPPELAVGMQNNTRTITQIGCGDTTPIASNLTLEFAPQPDPQNWLRLTGSLNGTLQPGEERLVNIRLNWLLPTGRQPYRGTVLVESNDPRQSAVRLPVELTVAPSPYWVWLPTLRQTAGQ